MPKLAAEREEVQAKLAVANQALKQAEKQHDETTAPLYARLREIKEATSAGESAKRELWDTCVDRDLLAQSADVQRRFAAEHSRATELREAATNYRGWARSERAHAERVAGALDRDRADEIRKLAEQHERKAKEADAELGKVEKAIAKLERDERAICEKMLVP